jgi:hypothetical protein
MTPSEAKYLLQLLRMSLDLATYSHVSGRPSCYEYLLNFGGSVN